VKFFTGTIYSKALAIFLAASLLLLGSVAALTQLIIFREFNQAEEREMQAMLQRFSVVMSRESWPLEVSSEEWARSEFVQKTILGKKPLPLGNATGSLGPEVLRESQVDFVFLESRDGGVQKIIFADEAKKVVLESDKTLRESLSQLAAGGIPIEAQVGYVLLNGQLCSVVICPIKLPEQDFPGGILVGGKIVSQKTWGFLEGLFSATIRFHIFSATAINESEGRDMVRLLNEQEIVIEAGDVNQIGGYRLIQGMAGHPLGYISISQQRPLRQQGLRAIQIFLSGIGLAGGLLVLVVWALLDRTILTRITSLTRMLEEEKRAGRLPVKLNFRGDDELGVLAHSIEDLATLLERTQSRYQEVVEDQTEMIFRFDATGQVAFANQVFARMFCSGDGIPENSLVRDLLPEAAGTDLMDRFRSLSPEMSLAVYTHEIIFPAGDSLWFRSTLRKKYSVAGECLGGQWVAADVTAQIQAQAQMLESERRFRRLFESASDGILVVDAESLRILDINPGLCRMLLLVGAEVLGRELGEVAAFAPCLDMVNYFRRSFRSDDDQIPFRHECRLERSDRAALFVELRCSEYRAAERKFIQLNFRNVTERVHGELELRKLSAKLLRLQDEERRRIARELHDSTAQNLSALEMNMSLLEPLVAGGSARAAKLVAETREIAGECSRELRNISYLLHPPLIDEVGLVFAINWFVDGFAKRTGIEVEVEIKEGFPRLDRDIEMPLFRVVQEAMTNVYRHSGARKARVILQREGNFLSLQIQDDGAGFQNEKPGHGEGPEGFSEIAPGVGLASMRERLANLGGKLDIETSARGVTLTIRLTIDPLHALSDS